MFEILRQRQMLQKAGVTKPLNIKFEPQSDAYIFSISPFAVPSGKIIVIRVQDIARNVWYNWGNQVTRGWDTSDWTGSEGETNLAGSPEVTVGINTLYISFYAVNEGGPGDMTFQMRADLETIAQKTVYVPAGAGDGVESGTIPMPDRTYDIWIAVAP